MDAGIRRWMIRRRVKPNWGIVAGLSLAAGLSFGAAPAFAQAAGQERAAPTFSVSGVVVNRVTGQPIARAMVDAGSDATLTDGDGRFELRLPEGGTQVTVKRPGFSEKEEDTQHRLQVNKDIADLQFSLTPTASLVGHVTLSNGDDAEGIRFSAYRRQVVEGHSRWMSVEMATTNSEGAFAFDGVEAPAEYVVCSMEVNDHSGRLAAATAAEAVVYGYPSTCFPGGTDFLSAGQLAVMPGQQKDMEIVLTRQRFYPVTISAPNGPPGQGVQVEVFDRAGRPSSSRARWNPRRGVVEMELPNGNYSLDVRSWGRQPLFGRMDLRVANAPVTGLTMTLSPLHPIEVEVRKEFTAVAQQDGMVNLGNNTFRNGNGPSVNISLLSRDSLIEGPMGVGMSHPEGTPSGVFQMEGAKPGRYTVRADAFEGYVSSITSGSTDLTREPLVVSAGGTAAPIEVTLRNDWGQINGMVHMPEGTANPETAVVYLYAIPQFSSAARPPVMVSDGGGTLLWPRVPPGTYRVVALDTAREINLDDAREMARWNALGQLVKVSPGGTANIEVDVVKSAELGATE